MIPRSDAMPATAPVNRRPAAGRHRTLDNRWDEAMTRLLRDAADVRERRERARASEDDRSARREAAALLELIRAPSRQNAVDGLLRARDAGRNRRS